jgi:hypothetical protein
MWRDCLLEILTVYPGPVHVMGHEAADDVVAQGRHVAGGRLGHEGRHLAEVADERARWGPVDALRRHGPSDPDWRQEVAGQGHPYRPQEQRYGSRGDRRDHDRRDRH